MARAATTTDAFNAVAEPRRREILDALAGGERSVNDLVARLGLPQPVVSKHLGVLREMGLVEVRDQGRQRIYRLNGQALKPIYDWVKTYERSWSAAFERLDVVLEELKEGREGDGGGGEQRSGGGDASFGHADPHHAGVRRPQAPGVQGVAAPELIRRWWAGDHGEVTRVVGALGSVPEPVGGR